MASSYAAALIHNAISTFSLQMNGTAAMVYLQYKKKYETKEKWAAKKNMICLLIALEETFNIIRALDAVTQ